MPTRPVSRILYLTITNRGQRLSSALLPRLRADRSRSQGATSQLSTVRSSFELVSSLFKTIDIVILTRDFSRSLSSFPGSSRHSATSSTAGCFGENRASTRSRPLTLRRAAASFVAVVVVGSRGLRGLFSDLPGSNSAFRSSSKRGEMRYGSFPSLPTCFLPSPYLARRRSSSLAPASATLVATSSTSGCAGCATLLTVAGCSLLQVGSRKSFREG